ncbi:uncharacterized protein LOC143281656 [Babylonia areolata]|uniref:uncharacterized protein LOC143281656 n=1 Tax=Babylonia areolata TaxID=304850 RepID=UPI003FD4213C
METIPKRGVKRKLPEIDVSDNFPYMQREIVLRQSMGKLEELDAATFEANLRRSILILNTVKYINRETRPEVVYGNSLMEGTNEIYGNSLSQSTQGALPDISTFIYPMLPLSPVPVHPPYGEEHDQLGSDSSVTDLLPCAPLANSQDSSYVHSQGQSFYQTGQTSTYPYSTVHYNPPIPSSSSYGTSTHLDSAMVTSASQSLEMPYDTPLLDSQSASSEFYSNPCANSLGEAEYANSLTSQWPYGDSTSSAIFEISSLNDADVMEILRHLEETGESGTGSGSDLEHSLTQPSTSQAPAVNTPCASYCRTDTPKTDIDSSVQITVGN